MMFPMRWCTTNSNAASPAMNDDQLEGTVTWSALLVETRTHLKTAGIDGDPHLESRWLVEEATGASGAELPDVLPTLATVGAVSRLDDMVARRAAGEPIQYVLGHWSFRNLDLMVDRRVLIPRPETEVVVEHAMRELDRLRPDATGTVVDLGTGSGAIGLAIVQERPGTRAVLTDVDSDAIAVARANLAGLGIIGGTVEIATGNWFEALPERLLGECDVIVANPPYVSTTTTLASSVSEWEPYAALFAGRDGLDDLRLIIAGSLRWLRPSGAVVLEMDPDQANVAQALAKAEGFDVDVHRDLAGLDRVLIARLRS